MILNDKREREALNSYIMSYGGEFIDKIHFGGFMEGVKWADERPTKESIVKALKLYDNFFGLSDGGIARDTEDLEYAEIILNSWQN